MFVFLKALLYSNQKELTNKEMVAPHLPITLLLFIILALHSLFESKDSKMPITNCICVLITFSMQAKGKKGELLKEPFKNYWKKHQRI
jgi:hypothetical protein